MEHGHSFMYMDSRDGKKYMGIELWPLSKRSQVSVSMSVDRDGPIVFMREQGSDTPIIPVQKTVGYRQGGARMIQVAFEGLEDKRFALAFDEPRLIEALSALLEAASVYSETTLPVLAAKSATIEDLGGAPIMRIELGNGASMAFLLPTEIVERLKEALAIK